MRSCVYEVTRQDIRSRENQCASCVENYCPRCTEVTHRLPRQAVPKRPTNQPSKGTTKFRYVIFVDMARQNAPPLVFTGVHFTLQEPRERVRGLHPDITLSSPKALNRQGLIGYLATIRAGKGDQRRGSVARHPMTIFSRMIAAASVRTTPRMRSVRQKPALRLRAIVSAASAI